MSTLAHLLVDLLSTAPGLVPIYREHLRAARRVAPELFITQVAGWLSGTMHAAGEHTIPGGAGGDAARTLVAVIETHMASGDAEVQELIALYVPRLRGRESGERGSAITLRTITPRRGGEARRLAGRVTHLP